MKATTKARIRNYYEALLLEERTVALTMDEARADFARAFGAVNRASLN